MGQKKKVRYTMPLNISQVSSREKQILKGELGQLSDSTVVRANRGGYITHSQRKRMRGQWWWLLLLLLAVHLSPVVLTIIAALKLVQAVSWDDFASLAFVCGPLIYYLARFTFPQGRYLLFLTWDVFDPQICLTMGQAIIEKEIFYPRRTILKLGELRFSSLAARAGSFREGYWYTLYYLAHSKTIISAEISRPEDFEAQPPGMIVTMGADGEIVVG